MLKTLWVTLFVGGLAWFSAPQSFAGEGDDNINCPQGWKSEQSRARVKMTDGGDKVRVTLAVDIPTSATVMEFTHPGKHPKFCWKNVSDSRWECFYTDPAQPPWFRFEGFHPDGPSPKGNGYKRYEVTAQNESHNLDRDALLVICYK